MWLDMPLQWLERYKLALQHILILSGVVFFSIYIVPRVPLLYALLLLAAIVGLGMIILFFQKPYLGAICTIPACLIAPIEIGTGTGSRLNAPILLLALLLGIWFLKTVVLRREIRVTKSRPIIVSLLFVLIAILALVVGRLSWFIIDGAPIMSQIGGLMVFVLSVGAMWFVAHHIHEPRWLEWMTWLFLILGAVYVVGRLLNPGSLADQFIQPGARGSLFWTWLMALALSLALFDQRLSIPLRVGLLGLVAATGYVAYFLLGEWKSGWVPPFVSIIVILALRWPKILGVYLLGGISQLPSLVARVIASDAYSYSTRLDAWQILFQMVKSNPILGFGPANYYWYTPLFPIRGYYVQFNSHSQYLDLIMQTGLLGLLLFFWLVAELGWLGWRLRSRFPSGFPAAYIAGTLGGLVGTVVAGFLGDWILPFVYNVGLNGFRASVLGWLFLGGLIAFEQIAARET